MTAHQKTLAEVAVLSATLGFLVGSLTAAAVARSQQAGVAHQVQRAYITIDENVSTFVDQTWQPVALLSVDLARGNGSTHPQLQRYGVTVELEGCQ